MAFEYNARLDSFLLNDLYGEDYETAAEMFDTFLNYVVPEFSGIQPLVDSQDRQGLKKLAHKIKPNFTMVGLADMQDMMKQIEVAALDEPDFNTIQDIVSDVSAALDEAKIIIQSDLERLKNA